MLRLARVDRLRGLDLGRAECATFGNLDRSWAVASSARGRRCWERLPGGGLRRG